MTTQSELLARENPTISVVIPLYNKANSIWNALNSVITQSFQDFEIIVIDDGSTDRGEEIVREFADPRITLIQQNNRGASAARNRGASESKSNLVAFLDADDVWKPTFLKTILRLKENFPESGMFATSYEMALPGGKKIYPVFHDPFTQSEGIITDLFRIALPDMPFYSSSVVVTKEALHKVGGFPEGVVLYEDIDTWMRIAFFYPIAFSKSSQVVYNLASENRACLIHFQKGDLPIAQTANKAIQSKVVSGKTAEDLREFVARHQLIATYHCLKTGDHKAASSILNSIRYTKRFRSQWLWWRFWTSMPYSVFKTASKLNKFLKYLLGKSSVEPFE